jgi:hypothetical protein
MGDWNEQASQNNNAPAEVDFKTEMFTEKRVQLNVQEQYGMESAKREQKAVRSQQFE